MPTQHDSTINLLAELKDTGAERGYRRWDFVENARQAGRMILVVSVAFVLLGFTDWMRHGAGATLAGALGLRLLVVAAGLGGAWAIGRSQRPESVFQIVLVFELLGVAAHWAVIGLFHVHVPATVLIQMLALLTIYLLIPNRFVLTVVAGATATVGYVAIGVLRFGATPAEIGQVAAALVFANGLGMLYGWRMHALRRAEYCELMGERELRGELEREIARRAHLEQELRVRATTDPLTGTSNRRHFMDLAKKEVGRSRRYGRPLSVMVIDIDNFKQINDSRGHAAGDAVLKRLASVLRHNLRTSDTVGRFGGDEFAVLVPEVTEQEAVLMAERMRGAMEAPGTDQDPGVTISVGVAALGAEDESIDGALHRADRALYRSKRQGRNQVTAAGAA